MKPKTIKVRVGRTVNLGKYDSYRFDVEEEVELDPGESDGEVIDMLADYLDAKVQRKIEGVLP